MDNRQKKIIKNTLLVFGLIICLACFACWIVYVAKGKELDESKSKVLGIIGSIGMVAPTVIGVIVKIYISIFMRKQNIIAIDNHLVESGIKPLSEIKQSNRSKKNKQKQQNTPPPKSCYGV